MEALNLSLETKIPYESANLAKQVRKVLSMLDRPTQRRIIARIKELARAPLDPRISSLIKFGRGKRKSRVGNWRIFFEVENGTDTPIFLAVRPRAQAYRTVGRA